MTRVKYIVFIMILLASILLLVPNISQAAEVKVTRNIYSNNGSMKFNFTGLTLDNTHEYEYGFTKTATSNVEKWNVIIEKTATTATVDIVTTDDDLREVINATDTGYVTIKDKTTDTIVLQPYAVDLKIPFLKLTNYTVIPNGKEFSRSQSESIQIALRNRSNSNPYYQYEKITNQDIINKYKEIKAKNGDFTSLQNVLKTTVPSSNWKEWSFWNGYSSNGMSGFGYTQSNVSVPDNGLYYMWLYFSGKDGIKNVYGYILVDNLEPDIAIESISLPKTATVEMGETLNLNVNFNPENATNKIVTWSSSDETVATVDNAGRVTPKKIGATIITVVSQDGNKKATCTVTVTGKTSNNGNNEGQNKGEASGDNNATNNKPTTDNNSSTNNQGTLNIGNANKENANTNEKKNDTTTAKGSLPQTGESAILLIVVLLAGLAGIGYVKYKKYQDIK